MNSPSVSCAGTGLLGDCRGGQGAEEGPEGIEFFVFEEEVAVDGILFDHLFDNVLRFRDAADLAGVLLYDAQRR